MTAARSRRFVCLPARRRPNWGRPAASIAPAGLTSGQRRLAGILAAYGGLDADDIYSRLNLGSTVDRDAFGRFVAFVQERWWLDPESDVSIRAQSIIALLAGYLALRGERFGRVVVRAMAEWLGHSLEGDVASSASVEPDGLVDK